MRRWHYMLCKVSVNLYLDSQIEESIQVYVLLFINGHLRGLNKGGIGNLHDL